MIKVIHNDSEYNTYVARVEHLIDAEPGSADFDELELLSTLIERYEEERFPIEAPTPVDAIRFRMAQMNYEPRDLEPMLGTRSRVSEILSGARPLSLEMIRALNRDLGIPAEVLIKSDPLPAAKAPVTLAKPAQDQLQALGLMRKSESLTHFLERAFGAGAAPALLRKTRTERANAKTDFNAVHAWCAGAIVRSENTALAKRYSKKLLNDEAIRSLVSLSRNADGPIRAREFLAEIGIAMVIVPHLPNTHLDGAALMRSDGTPVVALTLRRDRIDNFWFTLLHEVAHVKCHLSHQYHTIIDDLEVVTSDEFEREADVFAQDALIDPDIWATMKSGTYTSLHDVNELADRAAINPAIVAGRWQLQNRNYRKFARLLGHGEVRRLFREYPA